MEFSNKEALRLFGFAPVEMIQRDVLDLIRPSQHEEFEKLLRTVDAGTPVWQHFSHRVGKDGKPLLVHSRIEQWPRGRRRVHVIYDLTKEHNFDLLYAKGEEEERTDPQYETLVYVMINFEDLTATLDAGAAHEILRHYNAKVDKVIIGCGGVRDCPGWAIGQKAR